MSESIRVVSSRSLENDRFGVARQKVYFAPELFRDALARDPVSSDWIDRFLRQNKEERIGHCQSDAGLARDEVHSWTLSASARPIHGDNLWRMDAPFHEMRRFSGAFCLYCLYS